MTRLAPTLALLMGALLPLTLPAASAKVEQASRAFEAQCLSGTREMQRAPMDDMKRAAYGAFDAGQYCGCIGAAFRAQTTEADLVGEPSQKFLKGIEDATMSCAARQAGNVWASNCATLAEAYPSIPTDPAARQQFVDTMCSCMRPLASKVTGANFKQMQQQMQTDMARLQAGEEFEPGPLSFSSACVAEMKAFRTRHVGSMKPLSQMTMDEFISDSDKRCTEHAPTDKEDGADAKDKPWSKLYSHREVCSCITAQLRQQVTPADLATGNDRGIAEKIRLAGSSCAGEHIRAVIRNKCPEWIGTFPFYMKTPQAKQELVGTLCQCMQPQGAKLTLDNFKQVGEQTAADAKKMVTSLDFEPEPLSLFGGSCPADLRALQDRYAGVRLLAPRAVPLPKLDAAEQESAAGLAGWVDRECRRIYTEVQGSGRRPGLGFPAVDDYCGCVVDEARIGMTPELLRQGGTKEHADLFKKAVDACLERASAAMGLPPKPSR